MQHEYTISLLVIQTTMPTLPSMYSIVKKESLENYTNIDFFCIVWRLIREFTFSRFSDHLLCTSGIFKKIIMITKQCNAGHKQIHQPKSEPCTPYIKKKNSDANNVDTKV